MRQADIIVTASSSYFLHRLNVLVQFFRDRAMSWGRIQNEKIKGTLFFFLNFIMIFNSKKTVRSIFFSLCIPPLLSVENLQTLAASTVSARLEFVQQPQAVSVSALLAPTERSRHSWTQSQHCTGQRSARRPQRDSFVLSQRTDCLIYNLAACSLLDLPWEK